jgi:hypothetical protein
MEGTGQISPIQFIFISTPSYISHLTKRNKALARATNDQSAFEAAKQQAYASLILSPKEKGTNR